MKDDQKILKEYLDNKDVIGATRHVLSLADQRPIYEVYEDVISAVLSDIGLPDQDGKFDIVGEHVYSNMIKTVIENCIEEVARQSKPLNGKKVVVCALEAEYHEIGIRMINDYFKLAGFETIYLGCNIPNEDIMKAIMQNDVDYVAISVTNFYHLSNLRKLVTQIRKFSAIPVLVGGQAINNNPKFNIENEMNFKVLENSQTIFNMEATNETFL